MKRLNHRSRRDFIGGAFAASAASVLAEDAKDPAKPAKPEQIIKIGLIGCGGRGQWLIPLFQEHGGYELHAVADYFQNVANDAGAKFGVDSARCFSGLSGYKKVLESGVDAVLIEDVPYFYPEQARDAVAAGCHVYMAKPIAVDVPGCLTIEAAAREATRRKLCFLVDYQLPTDPAMQEIAKRVREGAIGPLAHIASYGMAWRAWPDPPLTANIESRLQDQIWLSDTALSGDTIVSYDIHIIDGLLALTGKRPLSACGSSHILRPEPHGDRTDAAAVVFNLHDRAIWTHVTQALDNNCDIQTLSASVFGMAATAHLRYSGKVYVRGGEAHYVGEVTNVFKDGVIRNIAAFHRNICEGRFENADVRRAVDGTLTAILGREAAARRQYLTMDELLKENKRLDVDLSGLRA